MMITDAQARVTAMSWHGGQGSKLYAFGSSGAIPQDGTALIGEIRHARRNADTEASATALTDLERYLVFSAPCGPQPGWASLWDDAFEKSL